MDVVKIRQVKEIIKSMTNTEILEIAVFCEDIVETHREDCADSQL